MSSPHPSICVVLYLHFWTIELLYAILLFNSHLTFSSIIHSFVVKNLLASARDARDRSLIPGSGRSPGVGNGNVLQYFCLEDSMGREPQRATVRGVTESDTIEHTHISAQVTYSDHNFMSLKMQSCTTGVPDLQDLMPNYLRRNCCINNWNEVHKKCNRLESSWNHPHDLLWGNIIFHKTGPWCQKGWGPLVS